MILAWVSVPIEIFLETFRSNVLLFSLAIANAYTALEAGATHIDTCMLLFKINLLCLLELNSY